MPESEEPAALLLIAHGTRDPRGATEMAELLERVRERLPGVAVAAGWLEDFAEPDPVTAAGGLLHGGPRTLVVLPLLHFAAGHAKYDVPREVAAVRAAWPGVRVHHGRVLGAHPALVAAAARRVGGEGDREGELLVVAASGSSDAEANGELAKAARMLAEATGHRWVEVCFAAVTWPSIDEVLARVAAAGARSAVLFSWSLLAGVLERRVADAAAATGVEVRLAGRFGPDPAVAEVVAERYAEALAEPPVRAELSA